MQYDDIVEGLVNTHQDYYSETFKAKNLILNQKIINGELEFDINIIFKNESFQKLFILTRIPSGSKSSLFDIIFATVAFPIPRIGALIILPMSFQLSLFSEALIYDKTSFISFLSEYRGFQPEELLPL